MDLDIDKLNSAFGQLRNFREAYNFLDFFIQPHIMHISICLKGFRPETTNRFHTHRTYEFSMPLYGKMQYIFENDKIEINSGDAVIIPPNKPHSWYALEKSLLFNIMLFISRHGDGAREEMKKFNNALHTHSYRLFKFSEYQSKINEIISEVENKQAGFDNKILCISREIYIDMFRKLLPNLPLSNDTLGTPPKHGNISTSIVELICYYASDNISRPIRMSEISKHIGLSINHMNRIFKAERGRTIKNYISHHKIEHSLDLLRKTNSSIKEIAASVGFDDVNYFCRIFKKHTGVTAKQFRMSLSSDADRIYEKMKRTTKDSEAMP